MGTTVGLEAQTEESFGLCWELIHDSSANSVLSPPQKPRPYGEHFRKKSRPNLVPTAINEAKTGQAVGPGGIY